MALSILDGNQSATTLSTILSSGQHITAHTVVSLGTQAITDMRGAVSGSVVSISNLPSTQTIAGTVTANVSSQDLYGQQATTGGSFLRSALYYEDLLSGAGEFLRVHNDSGGGLPIRTASSDVVNVSGTISADLNQPNFVGANGDILDYSVQIGYYDATAGEFRKVDSSVNPLPISGTVTANLSNAFINTSGGYQAVQFSTGLPVANERDGMTFDKIPFLVAGSVTIGSALPAGTNRIGVVTIGGGTVTIGAGTAQIGSVTASISNTAVTVYPAQGTTVTNSNFTSLTSSISLVSAVVGRKVLTVFNEGAGNLHLSPGATCTTISYQVRLSAGDYWECPQGQLSLAHTAVFATAGTARVTEVS